MSRLCQRCGSSLLIWCFLRLAGGTPIINTTEHRDTILQNSNVNSRMKNWYSNRKLFVCPVRKISPKRAAILHRLLAEAKNDPTWNSTDWSSWSFMFEFFGCLAWKYGVQWMSTCGRMIVTIACCVDDRSHVKIYVKDKPVASHWFIVFCLVFQSTFHVFAWHVGKTFGKTALPRVSPPSSKGIKGSITNTSNKLMIMSDQSTVCLEVFLSFKCLHLNIYAYIYIYTYILFWSH